MTNVITALICATLTFTAALQSSGNWVKYVSDEGRFTLLFPQQPRATTQPSTSRTGAKMTTHIFQAADASGNSYVASYVDYPYALDERKSLDGIRDMSLSIVKGTLLREYDIVSGTHNGREFVASVKSANADLMTQSRIFVVGNRSYMLVYVYLKSQDPEVAARNVGTFFDSFQTFQGKG